MKKHHSKPDDASLPVPSPDAPTEWTPDSDLIPIFLLRFDRENTRRAYASDLRDFFESDTVTLSQARRISFIDVNKYLERLEQAGASPATLKRRLATLRGFFAWLNALDLLIGSKNPADRHVVRRIRSVRRSDRIVQVLTRSQSQALLDAIDLEKPSGLRNRALVLTLLHCVLRRSEASAMDVEHIQRVGDHYALILPDTKGGSDQFVKMPGVVLQEINRMREGYGISSGALWRSLSNNSRGNRLTPTSIYRIVRDTARKAGIEEDIGAHTLRHTGCTLAIEAGASVQQVKEHARHKDRKSVV